MGSSSDVRMSQWISWALRHEPEAAGLTLDTAGWTSVDALLAAAQASGKDLSHARLLRIVAESDKQRFSLSPDGQRIRAAQGHSVKVELEHPQRSPPPQLFHGTATRSLASIEAEGLHAANRHHVHLSPDPKTAATVGGRHGVAVVLQVDAAAMADAGHTFFVSENGVWLTKTVPPQYLRRWEP